MERKKPKRVGKPKPLLLTCTKGPPCSCCSDVSTCAFCNTRARQLGKCGACKTERYCNDSCLANDWAEHGPFCGVEGVTKAFDFSFADYLDGVAEAYAAETAAATVWLPDTKCTACHLALPQGSDAVSCKACGQGLFCCRRCFTNNWPVHGLSCSRHEVGARSALNSEADCRALVLPGKCQDCAQVGGGRKDTVTAAVSSEGNEHVASCSYTSWHPASTGKVALQDDQFTQDDAPFFAANTAPKTAWVCSNKPLTVHVETEGADRQLTDSLDNSEVWAAVEAIERAYALKRSNGEAVGEWQVKRASKDATVDSGYDDHKGLSQQQLLSPEPPSPVFPARVRHRRKGPTTSTPNPKRKLL